MSEEAQSEDVTRFHLTFSIDRDKFFRRTCPSCGRDFKTQIDEADLAILLQPTFRQMGLEIGEKRSEEDEAKEHLHCPYCEHYAESSDMLTQNLISYLERHVMREYVLPKMNKTLSGIADTFKNIGKGSSGGLFSMQVSFEHDKPILPPRPISGPEPPDMTIVEFLCCGKKVKVLDRWYDLINLCPYCGTRVSLQ